VAEFLQGAELHSSRSTLQLPVVQALQVMAQMDDSFCPLWTPVLMAASQPSKFLAFAQVIVMAVP